MATSTKKAASAKKAVNGRKPATFDRLKSKKGLTRQVPVHLDAEVLEEYEQAKAELDLLSNTAVVERTTEAQQQATRDRFDAAKTALEETTEYVTIRPPRVEVEEEVGDDGDTITRALKGRVAYEYLLNENQASEEANEAHKAEHGSPAPYDADTFPPALVAACSDDDLTAENWADLFEEWTLNEVMAVFTAALEVCNASSVGRVGKG